MADFSAIDGVPTPFLLQGEHLAPTYNGVGHEATQATGVQDREHDASVKDVSREPQKPAVKSNFNRGFN